MNRPVHLLLCSIFALVVLSAPASAANIITNGDAEIGDLTGWADALGNGFTVWLSGSPPAQEGLFCFTGGVNGPSGARTNEIRQDLNVSAYSTTIDLGSVVGAFSGYARSGQTLGVTCSARLVVEYRNGVGMVLQSYDTGAVLPVNTWLSKGDTRLLPVGTRTIRIRLIGSRPSGTSTDAYFDAIVLQLDVPVSNAASSWGRIKSLYR